MSFKDLRLTLYDVLGYFPPGLVLLLAVLIGAWALVSEGCHIDLRPLQSWKVLLAILFVAYVLGHVAQVFANWLVRFNAERYLLGIQTGGRSKKFQDWMAKRLFKIEPLPSTVRDSVTAALRRYYSNHLLDCADPKSYQACYRLCDAVLSISEANEDREVFRSREGFYKGLVASLLLVGLTIFLAYWMKSNACEATGTILDFGDCQTWRTRLVVSGKMTLTSIVLTLLVVWGFYARYFEFAGHRARVTILGFLAIVSSSQGPSKAQ